MKKNSFKNKIKTYAKKIFNILLQPEMNVLPGQLAFFLLLSLMPILNLACYVASWAGMDYLKLTSIINDVIPFGGTYLVPNVETSLSITYIVLLIWMFYLATNGCNAIIISSNEIYGLKQSNWFKRRIKAIFMTIAIVALLIFLLIISVYGVRVSAIFDYLPYGEIIYSYVKGLKGLVIFIIILFFLTLFYNFAPDRVRKRNNISIGTIFCSVSWFVLTKIYGLVAQNMNGYIALYGGLNQLALLMVWVYALSYTFTIGIALNHGEELEENEQLLENDD